MMKKTRILFFTPSFSRGGSEMYLYYLLKNLDSNKFEIFLYSDSNGELTNEQFDFPLIANIKNSSFLSITWRKLIRKFFNYNSTNSKIKKIHKDFNPDLWYINTSVLPNIAQLAQELRVPYMVHFHELESVHDSIIGDLFIDMIQKAEAIVACSTPVKKMLNRIRRKNIVVQYEHVDLYPNKLGEQTDIRTKYNIPNEAFVWVMSGQKNYRKGYDMIPEIVTFLKNTNSFLIWLGGSRNYGINKLVDAGNYPNLIEPGLLRNLEYQAVLETANAFVLTAREDPFPLVMIEAASKGLPIISFNSGGVSEFVEEGMGKVINSCNVNDLCNTMQELMDGKIYINQNKSIEKAKRFDIKVKVKEWEKLLEKIIYE